MIILTSDGFSYESDTGAIKELKSSFHLDQHKYYVRTYHSRFLVTYAHESKSCMFSGTLSFFRRSQFLQFQARLRFLRIAHICVIILVVNLTHGTMYTWEIY
jgi:hypothetical protein